MSHEMIDRPAREEKSSPVKTVWNVVRKVLFWLVIAVAAFMMVFTIVSVTVFDRDERTLFGYRAYIVLSDSMSATDFNAGDLVLIKETDPATLQAGDIIAYRSQNTENYGEVVTHKIRQLTTDAEGNPGFITYGTTTNTDDEGVVTYSYVLGKYQSRIPKAGAFFQFLKTTPGYIVCILIPFLLLILFQGMNCVQLFRQYKREQMDEMKEERAKLEAERAENQKMMAELLALKSQLVSQQAEKSAANADTASDMSESNRE